MKKVWLLPFLIFSMSIFTMGSANEEANQESTEAVPAQAFEIQPQETPHGIPTDLNLEEKVGQLLIAHFRGENANDEAKVLINTVRVGGIIYYNWANQLSSPEQVQALSNGLQRLAHHNHSRIPLLIGVDQEGGNVARLQQGFTQFPSNRAVAHGRHLDLAHDMGHAVGGELKAVGINLNFAPVADIAGPCGSFVGVRSFGVHPATVTAFADAVLDGYQHEGVAACIKHFPGYGEANSDAHNDLPINKKTQKQIWEKELVPFQQLASKADCIMTGHIIVPAFDQERCATLSPTLLQGVLRKQIGYEGVIMSDSLVMEGFLKNCPSIEEGAVAAINAGCDMLILGGRHLHVGENGTELTAQDVQRIATALCQAVTSGVISHQRLDEAVSRVLQLKKKMGLSALTPPDHKEIEQSVGITEHIKLAEELSKQGVEVISNGNITYLEDSCQTVCLAPTIMKDIIEKSKLKHHTLIFFDHADPKSIQLPTCDKIIICPYNAWHYAKQRSFINKLMIKSEWREVVIIALADPYDAKLFFGADTIIATNSPTLASIDAAVVALSACNPAHYRADVQNWSTQEY
jgi:beta-N-acetylhexosaminidase